jgi:pimeloyl-ACP methyl ester carboxylesterase
MTRIAYLHGFASGPGSTKAQFLKTRLAARGRALEIPDLAPDFETATVGSMLAVVDALLEPGPAVLIGSSLGGYLAALAASQAPGLVPALVLLAPAFGFAARWEERVGPAAMADWRARGTTLVHHYARDREEPLSIALLDEARRHPDEPDPACPALVLHGRRDDTVPLEAAEHFVGRRPDRRRLVPYDSGHELTDVLDDLWTEIDAFLRTVP